jgi:hypothetical protein
MVLKKPESSNVGKHKDSEFCKTVSKIISNKFWI